VKNCQVWAWSQPCQWLNPQPSGRDTMIHVW
jgi:hypothetical protein